VNIEWANRKGKKKCKYCGRFYKNLTHHQKFCKEKKKLIKHIFEINPDRSDRSVANELNITRDQVRYWREHGKI